MKKKFSEHSALSPPPLTSCRLMKPTINADKFVCPPLGLSHRINKYVATHCFFSLNSAVTRRSVVWQMEFVLGLLCQAGHRFQFELQGTATVLQKWRTHPQGRRGDTL